MPAHKKILYHLSCAPFGSPSFKEGLDALLVSGTFEQQVSLLISHEAVWALLPNQNKQDNYLKIHSKGLRALNLYDIKDIYIDEASLLSRTIDPQHLQISGNIINTADIHALLAQQDIIMSYA